MCRNAYPSRAPPPISGVSRCGGAVQFASSTALNAPVASVRDIAELLDVDMDQAAGIGVFVAADRTAGTAIQVG